jgi:hypothetical protein
MRTLIALALSLQTAVLAAAQVPRFEDFPVQAVFTGTHAPPDLSNRQARMFRTRLREAVAYGPNFAGHYTLARWGCGAGCVVVAVIDARSGRVWFAPFRFEDAWGSDGHIACHHGSSFDLNSELFIVQGGIGDKAGTHYFRWRDERFTLVHFDPTCEQ